MASFRFLEIVVYARLGPAGALQGPGVQATRDNWCHGTERNGEEDDAGSWTCRGEWERGG